MKRVWKITGVSLLGVVVVLTALVLWFGWSWSPKEIVSVADQFHPAKDWKLTSETITPPRNLCIDDTCPQVIRSWDIPLPLKTKQEFLNITKLGSAQLYVDDDCLNLEQALEKRESCIAKGYLEQYYVRVEYDKKDIVTKNPHVRLEILEKKDAY